MINKGDLSVTLIITLYTQKKNLHSTITFTFTLFENSVANFFLAQTMESVILSMVN